MSSHILLLESFRPILCPHYPTPSCNIPCYVIFKLAGPREQRMLRDAATNSKLLFRPSAISSLSTTKLSSVSEMLPGISSLWKSTRVSFVSHPRLQDINALCQALLSMPIHPGVENENETDLLNIVRLLFFSCFHLGWRAKLKVFSEWPGELETVEAARFREKSKEPSRMKGLLCPCSLDGSSYFFVATLLLAKLTLRTHRTVNTPDDQWTSYVSFFLFFATHTIPRVFERSLSVFSCVRNKYKDTYTTTIPVYTMPLLNSCLRQRTRVTKLRGSQNLIHHSFINCVIRNRWSNTFKIMLRYYSRFADVGRIHGDRPRMDAGPQDDLKFESLVAWIPFKRNSKQRNSTARHRKRYDRPMSFRIKKYPPTFVKPSQDWFWGAGIQGSWMVTSFGCK